MFEISAAGLARCSLLCAYVRKNFCHTQVLRFFLCAIRYQFVKMSHVRPPHDHRILFIERLLQWAIGRAR